MLIVNFCSAFEYYLNLLVERDKCIKKVKSEKIKFETEQIENEENLFGKINSRCPCC